MTDRGATHGPAEYEFSSETSNAHIHYHFFAIDRVFDSAAWTSQLLIRCAVQTAAHGKFHGHP